MSDNKDSSDVDSDIHHYLDTRVVPRVTTTNFVTMMMTATVTKMMIISRRFRAFLGFVHNCVPMILPFYLRDPIRFLN